MSPTPTPTPTPAPTTNPAPPREERYHAAANDNRMNAMMILFAAASPLSSLIRLTFLLMEYWNGYDVYYSYDGAASGNSQHLLNGDISASASTSSASSSMGSCSINPLLDGPNSFLGNDEGTGISLVGTMGMASEGSNNGDGIGDGDGALSLADRIMSGNVTAEEVIHAMLSADPTATMSMSLRNRWNLNYPIATTYEYSNVNGNIVSTSTTVWQGDLISILPWLICFLAVVIVPLIWALASLMHARGYFQFFPFGYGIEHMNLNMNMNVGFGMYPGEVAQRNALERSNRLKRKRRAKILMACLDLFSMKLTKRNIQYQDTSMVASSPDENIMACNCTDPTYPNEGEGELEGAEIPTTNDVNSSGMNNYSEESSNQNQDEYTLLVGKSEKESQVWIPRAGMSTSHYEMYQDSDNENENGSSNKDINVSNNSDPLDPADFQQDSGNNHESENIFSPPNSSNSTISSGTDSKAGADLERPNPHISNSNNRDTMSVAGTCAICLSNYAVGESIVWSSNPACHHAFHTNCMKTWIRKKCLAECPCCRQGFVERSLYLAMKGEWKRMESEEKIGANANVSVNMNIDGGTSGNDRSSSMVREEDLIIEG